MWPKSLKKRKQDCLGLQNDKIRQDCYQLETVEQFTGSSKETETNGTQELGMPFNSQWKQRHNKFSRRHRMAQIFILSFRLRTCHQLRQVRSLQYTMTTPWLQRLQVFFSDRPADASFDLEDMEILWWLQRLVNCTNA